jgi:hypothetical protein
MSNDKKWKVHGLEKALESVPPEERPDLLSEIESIFEDFDPENPPGEPVVELAPGTRTCPKCGADLVELTVVPAGAGPDPAGPPLLLLDCEECEVGYCQTLETDLQ